MALSAGSLLGVLPTDNLAGDYSGALDLNNPSNTFAGAFSGDSAGLTNLNASRLTAGTVPSARLTGL